jgi:hypothetical protein
MDQAAGIVQFWARIIGEWLDLTRPEQARFVVTRVAAAGRKDDLLTVEGRFNETSREIGTFLFTFHKGGPSEILGELRNGERVRIASTRP